MRCGRSTTRLSASRLLSSCVLAFVVPACSKKDAEHIDSAKSKIVQDTTIFIGKTKLQSFQAKTGAVVVLGFTEVANIPGLYGSRAIVEARELTDATSGSRAAGIAVEVQESGTYGRKERSFVDYDELESLIRGIDYIGKIDRNPTRLSSFQADYRTKGDLVISTFSDNEGKTKIAVKSGIIGGASVYYPLSRLPEFRSAVSHAKALLDSISPVRAQDSTNKIQ